MVGNVEKDLVSKIFQINELRFEMIVWNLAEYITDVGTYLVKINVSDYDSFFVTDSFYVTITAEEPITTTTTSSTTSTTSTTPSETTLEEDPTSTSPEITPSFTLLQGMLVLLSIALFIKKRRR